MDLDKQVQGEQYSKLTGQKPPPFTAAAQDNDSANLSIWLLPEKEHPIQKLSNVKWIFYSSLRLFLLLGPVTCSYYLCSAR